MSIPATYNLFRFERILVGAFLLTLLAFGLVVEYRSAFLSRRMGDLGCYLRGAWAARTGANLYDVIDDNGWHYNYPPLLAIVMMPLADPPPGFAVADYTPYAVSVALCYALNLLFLFWAAHGLASALERSSSDPALRDQPRGCRRWWALRLWPIIACLVPIGHTLMRSQVNLLVLALLTSMIAGLLNRQNLRAGLFLALAICIKVIPVYLLVYPLWKRDVQGLLGCALGLFLGLVVVPVVALGPLETVTQYRSYAHVFFGPLLGMTDDQTRKDELLGVNATDAVGVKNALHNWCYSDPYTRPEALDPLANWTYRILGVLMTALVLWAGGLGRPITGVSLVLQLGCLIVLMVMYTPVSHMHYQALAFPLVAGLLAARWQGRTTLNLGWGLAFVFVVFTLTCTLPHLPGLERLKDVCLPLVGIFILWIAGVVQLWKSSSVNDDSVNVDFEKSVWLRARAEYESCHV